MKLAESLEQWKSDALKKYVYLLGGRSNITRKGERIAFICQRMLDAESLRALWQGMDDIAKRAVSTAYHNNGEFDADAFIAQYGQLPPRPEKESDWYGYYHKEPILFDLFVVNKYIPEDLLPLLADLVLPPERFRLEGRAKLPSATKRGRYTWDVTSVETELIGRADLLTYLQMVEQKQVKFGAKNNRLTAASVRQVLANLLDGDFSGTAGTGDGADDDTAVWPGRIHPGIRSRHPHRQTDQSRPHLSAHPGPGNYAGRF